MIISVNDIGIKRVQTLVSNLLFHYKIHFVKIIGVNLGFVQKDKGTNDLTVFVKKHFFYSGRPSLKTYGSKRVSICKKNI